MASDRELLQLTCETLTEAITSLRAPVLLPEGMSYWDAEVTRDALRAQALVVANDLALLHDRLKLEKDRLDEYARGQVAAADRFRGLPYPNVHAEEIADEVLRGEHDDHDWSPD